MPVMKIPQSVLSKLKLSDAAAEVVSGQFDRFPPLVLDRCIADCLSDLVMTIVASSQAGSKFAVETLTMPRRGFGPRPVTITAPATRAIYRALVQVLEGHLASNRTHEHWESHEQFGKPEIPVLPWDEFYLVEFDIASCYEYVEHELLRDELIARTMDVPHV